MMFAQLPPHQYWPRHFAQSNREYQHFRHELSTLLMRVRYGLRRHRHAHHLYDKNDDEESWPLQLAATKARNRRRRLTYSRIDVERRDTFLERMAPTIYAAARIELSAALRQSLYRQWVNAR